MVKEQINKQFLKLLNSKKVKYLILTTAGRAGSDFFHSLLDNHKQICQLPGCVYFDEFCRTVKLDDDPLEIAKKFTKDYEFLFNSKLSEFTNMERHHKLGEKKNQYYFFNKSKFIKNFVTIFNSKKKNFERLINSIHFSYYICSNQKLKEVKLILLNIHHYDRLKNLPIKKYDIIHMYRDPVSLVNSAVKSKIFTFRGALFNFRGLYWYLDRIFNEVKNFKNEKGKIFILKLEDLHLKNRFILRRFCKIFKINFSNTMMQSTFHNKKWWGDRLLKKDINGFNKKFENKINYNFFYKKDIYFYELISKEIIKKFDYPFRSKKKFLLINILLPLKIEILVLRYWLKKKSLKQFLAFIYFFTKRIYLFLCLIRNKKFHQNFTLI